MTLFVMTTQLDSASDAITINKLKPTFGAEVSGINLQQPLGDSEVRLIKSLLEDFKVIFFPQANLDSGQQKNFALAFGILTAAHPVVPPVNPEQPEVLQVGGADLHRNDIWHSDVTFVTRPPAAGILRAVSVPAVGGDTNWADLEAAYDSLSKPVQELAEKLQASHSGAKEFAGVLKKYG